MVPGGVLGHESFLEAEEQLLERMWHLENVLRD
jgi:hypothetical protein